MQLETGREFITWSQCLRIILVGTTLSNVESCSYMVNNREELIQVSKSFLCEDLVKVSFTGLHRGTRRFRVCFAIRKLEP